MAETDESYSGPEPNGDIPSDLPTDITYLPGDMPSYEYTPGGSLPNISVINSTIPPYAIVNGIPAIESEPLPDSKYVHVGTGGKLRIYGVVTSDYPTKDFYAGNIIHTPDPSRGIVPSEGVSRVIKVNGTPKANFSLTMTDINGCNVLANPLNNVHIPSTGTYSFTQKFPPLLKSLDYNRFDIVITPLTNTILTDSLPEIDAADSRIYSVNTNNPNDVLGPRFSDYNPSAEKYSIFQFPKTVATFTRRTESTGSTNPKTLTLAGDSVTITGNPFSEPSGNTTTATEKWNSKLRKFVSRRTISNSTEKVSWTATKDSGFAGNLYISRQPKLSDFGSDISYTKTTTDHCGTLEHFNIVVDENDIRGKSSQCNKIKLSNTTDLEVGMSVIGESSFTKKVVSSVYPSDQDPCDLYTDTFVLNNVKDIFPDMKIQHPVDDVEGDVGIISIGGCENENTITISSKQKIKNGTELTFVYPIDTKIESVDDLHYITTRDLVTVSRGVTLTFEISGMLVDADLLATGSGSDIITIAGKVSVSSFGTKNVTHTLNVDNFITNTPNTYDITIPVTKSTAIAIKMTAGDLDLNRIYKQAAVVSGPSHGTVGSYSITDDTITYTPTTNYVGKDKFTFTMSDYSGDSIVSTSGEKTVNLIVT